MYVDCADWSKEDPGDPPPCFRQGDVVELTWVHPQVQFVDESTTRITQLEIRKAPAALLSPCCDLVIRTPPKRRGVLMSPLRPVPANMRKPDMRRALTAKAAEAVAEKLRVPANLFFYALGNGYDESVIYLEELTMVAYANLGRAKKLAELTSEYRSELQEKLKFHFTHSQHPLAGVSA